MSDVILVVNAGSSSIKFKLYRVADGAPALLLAGAMSGIGSRPALSVTDGAGAVVDARGYAPGDVPDTAAAQHCVADWLRHHVGEAAITAVGHRVVHGGPAHAEPVRIDDAVLRRLESFVPLAPLHQLRNLDPIRVLRQRRPDLPQVACFDTAFHRTQAWEADTFALPPAFYAQGIRRYGFHGLSYEYIARSLAAEDAALGAGRLVVAHLGNGASLCAIAGGKSRATTMGFTALDGVPMGTRSGQIDPGVLLHLIDTLGMTTKEVTRLLYNDSGLKGLSGVSQDVREIEAAGTEQAERALSHFAFRVRREIGAMAATLGGIDALVFTAGIGENARALRARICDGLGFLGIRLDADRNAANAREISAAGAAVRVLVRRTDEERMIAEHTLALVHPG